MKAQTVFVVLAILLVSVESAFGSTPSPSSTTVAHSPMTICDLAGHCVRTDSKSGDKWVYVGKNNNNEKLYLDLTTAFFMIDPHDGSISVQATVKYKGIKNGTFMAFVDCDAGTIVFSLNPILSTNILDFSLKPRHQINKNIFNTICTNLRKREGTQ